MIKYSAIYLSNFSSEFFDELKDGNLIIYRISINILAPFGNNNLIRYFHLTSDTEFIQYLAKFY